jgi:hypothetical protein
MGRVYENPLILSMGLTPMQAISVASDRITRRVVQVSHLPHIEDLDFLKDPELDAWNAALMQQPASYTYGPVHRDY